MNTIKTISIRNILLNAALSSLKIAAGLLTGSLAVLSDGLNSLSDAATTVVVLFSRRVTEKPKDEDHPYGHEKIESIVSFCIAIFLAMVALFTIYQSILNLMERRAIEHSFFALGATLLSAAVKYYMYRSTRLAANKHDSDMLHLVALDYRFDVFLSGSVFLGLLMTLFGLWFFEPIAAIIASVVLFVSSAKFMNKAFNQVVDKAADETVVESIRESALQCSGVIDVDAIKTRQHGPLIYVDIDISVNPDITVKEGHDIAQRVHDKLEEVGSLKIKHCNVHVNPSNRTNTNE